MIKILSDITRWMCSPETPLKDIMLRFNEIEQPFMIVVDADLCPIGTITDGDIRRGILAKIALESPVLEVMNAEPQISQRENAAETRALLEVVDFVPVTNVAGKLVEIWVAHADDRRRPVVLIMAGGLGKRLGHWTEDIPKPLLAVGGQPILARVLDWLEKYGHDTIFISTHYLAEQIAEFVGKRGGTKVAQILHEPEMLGTAGAISLLPPDLHGSLLVVNADVITDFDLDAFMTYHETHDNDATIVVTPHEVKIPFGVVRYDNEGNFVGIDEKPTLTNFVASGIYLIEPELRQLVAPNARLDMPELINLGHQSGLKIGLFPIHEYWIDIGRPDDLRTAIDDHQGDVK